MDFEDTPEEAEFRAEVRDFLDANAERKAPGASFAIPYGGDGLVTAAKEWQAKKAAAGFAGITQPQEYGGRGGTVIEQVIYNQEEADYVTPIGVYEIGLGMCIPTMLAYATEEQKQRYAPPAFRGEEIWCQLFSEPQAGSDLANLRLRAERDGDDWILNGQKIWTSGAHFSDFGVIVTRSDPEQAKHKGLTYFFIDMKSPGIECRRIHQISGTSNFNEVFFTDVRVPDSQRLGAVGDGWRVFVDHVDERTARHWRAPTSRIRRGYGPRKADRIGERPRDRGRRCPRQNRRLVRECPRRHLGTLSEHDGSLARPGPRTRKLHRQGADRQDASGYRGLRHGLDGPVRRHFRSGARHHARHVPGCATCRTQRQDCGGNRRNSSQHHC